MKLKTLIFIGFYLLAYPIQLLAQDIHFSNLKMAEIYNSVGSIGAGEASFKTTSIYRNQWPTVGKAYNTIGLAVEGKLDLDKNALGFGLIVNRDQAGELSLTKLQAEGAIVYHQQVSLYSHLSGGIQGGIIQHSIDGTKSEWQNQFNGKQFDASRPSGEDPLFKPFINYTLGAGVQWKYDNNRPYTQEGVMSKLQFGFSMYHLSSSKLTYLTKQNENMRFVLSGSSVIGLDFNNSVLEPAFVYQQKGPEKELIFGAMYKYIIRKGARYTNFTKRIDFALGTYYRLPNDAFVPTFNMTYGNFELGLSYDINISPLIQASNSVGGIEFSLRFSI